MQTRVNELETRQAQDIALLKNEIEALEQFVFPGPRPKDKEMRKTWNKELKVRSYLSASLLAYCLLLGWS